MDLDKKRIDTIIRFALKEDIWTGDITSESVLEDSLNIDAVILSREDGVACGMDIIEKIFSSVDEDLKFRPLVKDGDDIKAGCEVAFIEGKAISIMKAERTALNFLSLLSGIATTTSELVNKIKGTKAKIYDTRKTIPLHRYLEKYAVTVGGGNNHRKGLWDMVLIKDNHIRAFELETKTTDSKIVIKKIIKRVREAVQKNVRIEIEVETLKECEYALKEMPDVIMLDNMTSETVKKAVALRKSKGLEDKVLLEVSGGITIDNVKRYAETGIDIISTSLITISPRPIDFSLEVVLGKA
ncbi:MAG: carboxylating nicotinate-nucleotide diphosphorylase [Candidatus Omnitrophota bacterium]